MTISQRYTDTPMAPSASTDTNAGALSGGSEMFLVMPGWASMQQTQYDCAYA